jgi:hypothetical protein
MTDSLHIDSGEVRLLIDGDPERVIVFNPSSVIFAEKFQSLRFEVAHKMEECQAKAEELGKVPDDAEALIDLRSSTIDYLRAKIDEIFGAGTSQTAFGDLRSEQAIGSFLKGVAPYVQLVREEKLAKYVQSPVAAKRRKHANVMK